MQIVNEPGKHIRYLQRSEIDLAKWDYCIEHSPNGLIYARSFYLDAMAENWSGLVAGDYDAVMPLTWKKKFGFTYLYQPYFTKTLGVFGSMSYPVEISSFLQAIPRMFVYWDIDLNETNIVLNEKNKLPLKQFARTNYFLSLQEDYIHLNHGYKRLANRMNKKAVENNLQITRGTEPSVIIRLYQKDYSGRHRSITPDIYDRLVLCTKSALEKNMAETYLSKTVSGEILAYYIILRDERFVYSLLGGSSSHGKETGAFYMLTDTIIRDHAGSNRIFRFEGSDIPGISFFDSLFGPEKISYPHLLMNKLPFPFNLLKK